MNIQFHRSFKKKYKKVPAKIQKQFDTRLLLFEKERFHPTLNTHMLSGDRDGEWSINVTGDWRALFVSETPDIVVFIDIGTHSDLYS